MTHKNTNKMKTMDHKLSENAQVKSILSNVMLSSLYESEHDKVNRCVNVIKSVVNDALRGIDSPELEEYGYACLMAFVPSPIHDSVCRLLS